MSGNAGSLIDGSLDEVLTLEQHQDLPAWINASPEKRANVCDCSDVA